MSERERLFRRRGGAGWVILAEALPQIGGAHRELGERLLERIDLSRQPIFVASDDSDQAAIAGFMEDLEAWLGVEIALLQPDELRALPWQEAGLVVLAGGPATAWAAWLQPQGGEQLVLEDAGAGSLVYAAAASAEALGTWMLGSNGEPAHGIGWLPGALILPGRPAPSEVRGVTDLLAREDHSYAVGLGEGAVLALGPKGEVEVWGEARPTVTLGRGWR